jgi:hypothetical protein
MLRAALLALLFAAPVQAEIASARFTAPTNRYDHGILGDAIEYGALELTLTDGRRLQFTLPETRVFEDLEPRLADLDGDGLVEVIVVETLMTKGAQLAVYTETGKLAATPHLGRSHRWLAPIGMADLDGDGTVELAYIEKPHLSKILRIWQLKGKKLHQVANLTGLTNHQIGQDFISGGIRVCDGKTEIITVDADWSHIMATTFSKGKLTVKSLGPFIGQKSLKAALDCS